ncbi:MAG: hypothetical protein KKG33_11315, partial [candidate division Zixibacteria bacterium]|nr:hypothetical protein [candidate division Zixibacteria bacterium]
NQQPAEEAPNREKVYTETELNSLIGDVEKVMAEDLMRADEELQVSKQQMAVLVGQSEYWEFSYLNYFLVPNTKRFLFELSYAVSATASIFENNMILIQKIGVSERSELKAIRDAILQHSLAAENENRGLVLTDKGRRFLRFLGFESPGSSSVT